MYLCMFQLEDVSFLHYEIFWNIMIFSITNFHNMKSLFLLITVELV